MTPTYTIDEIIDVVRPYMLIAMNAAGVSEDEAERRVRVAIQCVIGELTAERHMSKGASDLLEAEHTCHDHSDFWDKHWSGKQEHYRGRSSCATHPQLGPHIQLKGCKLSTDTTS